MGCLQRLGQLARRITTGDEDEDGVRRQQYVPEQASLFLLPPQSKPRRIIVAVVESPWFELFILLVIAANSVMLALWDPLQGPNEGINAVVNESDFVFLGIYTVEVMEFLMRVLARGLFLDKFSYLRDPWNIMDFVILVLGYVVVFGETDANLSPLRLFRLLRPLRTMRGIAAMRSLVTTVVASVPALFNVVAQYLFVFCIFGILGLQLWIGVLRQRCAPLDDPTVVAYPPRICSNVGGVQGLVCAEDEQCVRNFENPNFGFTSFDNIGASFLTIFQLLSKEGWSQIMYMVQDAWSEWAFLYFVLLLMISSFILVHLALGIVLTKFGKNLLESGDPSVQYVPSFFLRNRRTKGTDTSRVRMWALQIIRHPAFSITLSCLIVLNVVLLCIEFHNMPTELESALVISNICLVVLFVLAAVTRIVALQPRAYFGDKLNVFDFVVVCIGVVEVLLVAFGVEDASGISTAFKALRVMRLFKLMRFWRTLYELIEAIYQSAGSLITLLLFMSLFLYIFTLIGMNFFGGKLAQNGVTPRSNFDSFTWAFVTVFQILTGENWQYVLWDAMRATSWVAALYFVIFSMFAEYLLINLFMSVMVKNFAIVRRIFRSGNEITKALPSDLSANYRANLQRKQAHVDGNGHGEDNDGALEGSGGGGRGGDHRDHDDDDDNGEAGMLRQSSRGGSSSGANDHQGHHHEMVEMDTLDPVDLDHVARRDSQLREFVEFANSYNSRGQRRSSHERDQLTVTIPRYTVLEQQPPADVAHRLSTGEQGAKLGVPVGQMVSISPRVSVGSAAGLEAPTDAISKRPSSNLRDSRPVAGILKPYSMKYDKNAKTMVPQHTELRSTNGRLERSRSEANHAEHAASNRLRAVSSDMSPRMNVVPLFGSESGLNRTTNAMRRKGSAGGGGDAAGVAALGPAPDERDEQHPQEQKEELLVPPGVELEHDDDQGGEQDDDVLPPPLLLHVSMLDAEEQQELVADSYSGSEAADDGGHTTVHEKKKKEEEEEEDHVSDGGGRRASADVSIASASEDDGPPPPLLLAPDDVPTVAVSAAARQQEHVSPASPPLAAVVMKLRKDKTHLAHHRSKSGPLAPLTIEEVEASPRPEVLQEAREHQARMVRSYSWTAGVDADHWVPDSPHARALAEAGDTTHEENEQNVPSMAENSMSDLPPSVRTLNYFTVDNRFRIVCEKIVRHRFFEYGIFVTILFSCVALALDSPDVADDETWQAAFLWVDIVTTTVFFVEACLKLVVYGLVMHPRSYLRRPWNILDVFVLIVAIVGLGIANQALRAVKGGRSLRVLRVLRAMRPLRVVGQSSAIKLVIGSLVKALPAIGNVVFVSSLIWVIFAILGLQLYKGRFYFCNDPTVATEAECTPELITISRTGLDGAVRNETVVRQWANPNYSFDNFGAAMLALFQVATTEGWLDVMYSAIDARGVGEQPVRDNQPGHALFFITFLVIGSFFVLNLFVCVIIDNYCSIKLAERESNKKALLLSNASIDWARARREVKRLGRANSVDGSAPKTMAPWRQRLYRIVRHRRFEIAMLTVIVLNIVFMMVTYYGAPESLLDALDVLNIAFVVVFCIEAVVKTLALGVRGYFADNWNKFDFLVLIGSIAGVIVDQEAASNLTVLRIFRIFRLVRIFRMVEFNETLRTMFLTLFYTLPSIINVGALLFLLMFVYSIWGMTFFGTVRYGQVLNEKNNFANFTNSMLLLFRVLTGDNWIQIMWDCMVEPPNCDPELDECGTLAAPLFFITYVILGSFIVINLFIALVLENFMDMSDHEESFLSRLRSDDRNAMVRRRLST